MGWLSGRGGGELVQDLEHSTEFKIFKTPMLICQETREEHTAWALCQKPLQKPWRQGGYHTKGLLALDGIDHALIVIVLDGNLAQGVRSSLVRQEVDRRTKAVPLQQALAQGPV